MGERLHYSRGITKTTVPKELMAEMRSSVFLMGSLLARSGEAVIYRPGGCDIGKRPIDIHISGLEQLGFEVAVRDEEVSCWGRCRGGKVTLPYPSGKSHDGGSCRRRRHNNRKLCHRT